MAGEISKVYKPQDQGGDRLVVASGGVLKCESGSSVLLEGLPTSDPGVSGALWSNSGAVTVSAGTTTTTTAAPTTTTTAAPTTTTTGA
ncbi:MAG: hypothetical protein ACOY3P_06995 [Planctomycetota bacterium]